MIDALHEINWRSVWLATQIFIGLVAVIALGIWFLEPFGWAWRAASVIALGTIWWTIFKLCQVLAGAGYADHGKAIARKRPTITDKTESEKPLRDVATRHSPLATGFTKPPKTARYTWTLLEDGVPVGVEHFKPAVENWLALSPTHDAEAHKLPVHAQ